MGCCFFWFWCGYFVRVWKPVSIFPIPYYWTRSLELFQAWYTIHISHSDVAWYWESLSGIPILAPGATVVFAAVCKEFLKSHILELTWVGDILSEWLLEWISRSLMWCHCAIAKIRPFSKIVCEVAVIRFMVKTVHPALKTDFPSASRLSFFGFRSRMKSLKSFVPHMHGSGENRQWVILRIHVYNIYNYLYRQIYIYIPIISPDFKWGQLLDGTHQSVPFLSIRSSCFFQNGL